MDMVKTATAQLLIKEPYFSHAITKEKNKHFKDYTVQYPFFLVQLVAHGKYCKNQNGF